ncbi:MAG: methyltransferase domain-containing protein [Bacteroidetes bacterium]|nr:methyltransferase domain-containing protein [Bacteroidota bacterium]
MIIPSYNPINTLGIGLGNPIEYSKIEIGSAVLHLGCSTGDDSFAIRRIVGETGRVIGIDYDINNIAISRQNCGNFGYSNVTFFVRDIEKLLFDNENFDVVVCNYSINLMPNKSNILKEINRVLKINGKLIISDLLPNKTIPDDFNNKICGKYQQIVKSNLNNFTKLLTNNEYILLLNNHNFFDTKINTERTINADDGELLLYIDYENISKWHELAIELYKIVSYSVKRNV